MKLFPIQTQTDTDTHIQLYVHTYTLLPVCHTIFIWQVSEIQRFTNFLVRRSPRCIFTVTDSNIALSYGGVLKMLVTWQCISTCEKISLTSEKDRDRLREKERDREKDRDRDRDRDIQRQRQSVHFAQGTIVATGMIEVRSFLTVSLSQLQGYGSFFEHLALIHSFITYSCIYPLKHSRIC